MHDISQQDRNIAFLIFGFLLACYLFTYTGWIDSSDGLAMFATAESMVRRGEIDSNQLLWMGNQQGNIGPDGDLYSRKGLGMTLLTWPLLWLAQRGALLGLIQAALLLNPLFTAYTGALVFRLGRRLNWTRNTALATAFSFGLATLAWPYTQGFFSDPLCGWGLVATLYGLLAYRQTGYKEYLWAGGAAWGITYLTRTVNLVTLPVFALALYSLIRQRTRQDSVPLALSHFFTRQWRPLVSFFVPVVAAGLISLWWNWLRFGSVWDSGYVESESFTGDWLFGLYGLLLSPARGFFWYSPVLLLFLLGISWFWREARWLLITSGAIGLIYLLLYSKWYMWHGGYSWGPRFLVPLAPLLALLCGPAWAQLVEERRWGAMGRSLVIGLAVLSGAVQWLGMLAPFTLGQDWLANNISPLFALETFTQLGLSPLVLQWRYLTPANFPFAWWRSAATTGAIDWAGLLAPVASALLGLVLIWRQRQQLRVDQPHYNWWYGLLLCVLALALLVRYQRGLVDPTQQLVATRIERSEQAGDAILFLQPEQTQQFANIYHGHLPSYGLAQSGSLTAPDEGWLQKIEARHQRLWVVPGALLPEQSGWERHLRTHDFLLQEARLVESGERLALYALAPAQAELLVESGLGTIFGDPAQPEGAIDETNGWIRLKSYGLTTEMTPGAALLLALRWESLRKVSYDYHVFVHLVNSQGEKLAQRDGQPVQWLRPTSTWQPGEEIIDHYGLVLPDDLAPGEYTILVGLYDPVSGQRLPLSAGPGDFTVGLGPVTVRP